MEMLLKWGVMLISVFVINKNLNMNHLRFRKFFGKFARVSLRFLKTFLFVLVVSLFANVINFFMVHSTTLSVDPT
jgi:hypothetical protein